MKLPLLPGPADLVSAAEGLRDLVTQSLALVPRVVTAVGQAELLLDRVSVLLARVEAVVDRAEDAVTGVQETRARADAAVAGVVTTQAAADAAIRSVDATRTSADDLVGAAGGLLDRAAPLVEAYEPALTQIAPLLQRFADDLDDTEVEALVTLVDRLPTIVGHLDDDVLPVLAGLDNLAPDVHALLDTVQDLREIAKGFPGSKLFRRRGAEEIAEEEAAERAGR